MRLCDCVCHTCAPHGGRVNLHVQGGALMHRPRSGGRNLFALLVLMSRKPFIELLNMLALSARSLGARDLPFPLFSLFASSASHRFRRSFRCLYVFLRISATAFFLVSATCQISNHGWSTRCISLWLPPYTPRSWMCLDSSTSTTFSPARMFQAWAWPLTGRMFEKGT